jgi:RNA polymerase sigma-70 factor (ECF subfamily)
MGDHSTSSLVQPQLIERVGQGNQEAFSELYDQTCGVVFVLAHRILGNPEEASILLQEVYAEIWKRAHEFASEKGTAFTWIMVLARQKGIRRFRSREWSKPIDSEEVKDFDRSLSNVPLIEQNDPCAQKEIRDVLQNVVRQLPKEQAEVLELAYYEGLTLAEIAVRLQEPVGTIKTRIRLAMYKLRASLQSYWSQE